MFEYIQDDTIKTFGEYTELFKCNYDYDLLDLINHLPEFYKQITKYWHEIASTTTHGKNEVPS